MVYVGEQNVGNVMEIPTADKVNPTFGQPLEFIGNFIKRFFCTKKLGALDILQINPIAWNMHIPFLQFQCTIKIQNSDYPLQAISLPIKYSPFLKNDPF